MSTQPSYRKKLIEVDIPLADITRESTNGKGHPFGLHKWWARRPLIACRAIIFASMVDDPSSCEDEFPTKSEQDKERRRLHNLIGRLVQWKNSDNASLIAEARYEIARSIARSRNDTPSKDRDAVLLYLAEHAPTIYDPFCGGGSIPLEAQRLGMKSVGSDLNPVAVLITKALIELPFKFNGRPPINPDADRMGGDWKGASGLADDIRYYGEWMQDRAFKRIGHLYPNVEDADGNQRTVMAWLWTRTVSCPNPACGIEMPLIKSFQISNKRGNQYWTRPIIDRDARSISFTVQDNDCGVLDQETINRNGATCVACENTVNLDYIRDQAKTGNMGVKMTAIAAKGDKKRLLLSPDEKHVQTAINSEPDWRPVGSLPKKALGFRVQRYGFEDWHQLFTNRQLTALTILSDLASDVRDLIISNGFSEEYANAIFTYIALGISNTASGNCSFNRWMMRGSVVGLFSRQALSMIWDFAEANPFSSSGKSWMAQIEKIASAVEHLPANVNISKAYQADASTSTYINDGPIIVTDPPYYDNIGYADLSDFFYVWLRPLLREIYPNLFASILTPKIEEAVAAPRFENSRERFESVLFQTLKQIRVSCTDEFPSSVFYAYKQQEEQRNGTISTGWDTMLSALVSAGFRVTGTWPVRMELSVRQRSLGSNALATCVVIVCRPRPADAAIATRRQFLSELEQELPPALEKLTMGGHIGPVDLPQAAIGPGMEIYSRYSKVIRNDGKPVTVRDALVAINDAVARYFEAQEGELDNETRLCLDWARQHGSAAGLYGDAETLAMARNLATSTVNDIQHLMTAKGGKVQLNPISSFAPERKSSEREITAWEGCMRMAYHFSHEDGKRVEGAAQVAVYKLNGNTESVERLARILYDHYDRKREPSNALIYNTLVQSMPEIRARADEIERGTQGTLT